MKTTVAYSVSVEIASAVKNKAESLRLAASELAEIFLARSLAEMSDDEINSVVGVRRETTVQNSGRMHRWERAVIDAQAALAARSADIEKDDPAYMARHFPLKMFAREAGLYPSEALKGLRMAERRGALQRFELVDVESIRAGRDEALPVEHWGPPALGPKR